MVDVVDQRGENEAVDHGQQKLGEGCLMEKLKILEPEREMWVDTFRKLTTEDLKILVEKTEKGTKEAKEKGMQYLVDLSHDILTLIHAELENRK